MTKSIRVCDYTMFAIQIMYNNNPKALCWIYASYDNKSFLKIKSSRYKITSHGNMLWHFQDFDFIYIKMRYKDFSEGKSKSKLTGAVLCGKEFILDKESL